MMTTLYRQMAMVKNPCDAFLTPTHLPLPMLPKDPMVKTSASSCRARLWTLCPGLQLAQLAHRGRTSH